MAYSSLSDFKAYRGIAEDTDDDDDLISSLLESAQSIIDAYCHRTFEASTDATRTFDAVENVYGRTLWIDGDLCAIKKVTNGDGAEVEDDDYVTEPRNETPYYALKLKASSGVYWRANNDGDPENAISVTGKWAYSQEAPSDIAHACLRLAAHLYDQKDNAGDMDRPVVVNAVTTILPSRLPADVIDLLKPYRRLV